MVEEAVEQTQTRQPEGELVTRTIAMPADTNASGDIFGGWLISQMDLGGSVLARKTSKSRVVTVAVDSMTFLYPVSVGDLVSCYARLQRMGHTSMTIHLEAWVRRGIEEQAFCVTEGVFTYVAVSESGRPIPVIR